MQGYLFLLCYLLPLSISDNRICRLPLLLAYTCCIQL